ncbi:MAG: GNAT family N-acetyltransferase [bacterium]
MPGYRFCRTDDLGLLADAYNRCIAAHVPGAPALTAERLKRRGRNVDFWASSSMLAFGDDGPIGVLLAAKRTAATCLLAVGLHPDHRRQGHARHLLGSLAQKLEILGPPRLIFEVDATDAATHGLLAACGWRETGELADLVRESETHAAPRPPQALPDLATPVTFDELAAVGTIGSCESWTRARATLKRRAGELEGLAILSDRVEAFCLFEHGPDGAELSIAALGAPGSDAALAPLVDALAARGAARLRIPRLGTDEVSIDLLAALGFRSERRWSRFSLDVSVG